MPSSDDDSAFSSANNKTDGKNLLVIKSTQRVAFEQISPPGIMINGQLWKYGDRYGCFRMQMLTNTKQAHAKYSHYILN